MTAAWQILHGDCLDKMREMDANSVDALITSPPYAEQRKTTYGGIPEAEYPSWTVAWMEEAKRVLKPNGSAIINIRPHIKGGKVSNYVLRTRLALQDAGWNECEELIWHKPGSMPMGSIHRPRRSWESLLWYAKHGKPYANPKAAGTPYDKIQTGKGRGGPHVHGGQDYKSGMNGTARVPDLISIPTRLNSNNGELNNHPAPYPWQLAEWCAKLTCPEGGVILDPFSGSASTGVAAIKNGWGYIGIEAIPEYAEMSRARLQAITASGAGVAA